MNNHIIIFLLYTLPIIPAIYIFSLFRMAILPGRLSVFTQMRQYFDVRKEDLIGFYRRDDMLQQFEEAGLISIGLTPMRFRIIRDGIFILMALIVNFRFLINMDKPYPISTMVFLLLLYILFQMRESFPIKYMLSYLKIKYERQKNAEIFILQQLVSNEFADMNTSKQNVYHMFMYMRRYLKHIRPAVDKFLDEYPLDPNNKEKAYRSFAKVVGTVEAESLSEILYQVDQSSPKEVQQILQKRYEELKKKRQEAYKSAMTDRGTFGYVLAFSGVMMVVVFGLFVYYLEYKDMMGNTYNMGG